MHIITKLARRGGHQYTREISGRDHALCNKQSHAVPASQLLCIYYLQTHIQKKMQRETWEWCKTGIRVVSYGVV
jgi:hypothetical protein